MVQKIFAVGVIIENAKGEILVLKRNPDKPEGDKWGLPGGKVDYGETKNEAVIREIKEEINYIIEPDHLIFINKYKWDYDDIIVNFSVFKINIVKDISIILNIAESSEYLWSKPEKLYQKNDLMRGLYPILEDSYNS